MPWPKDKPLRASINNFGYGGTNAHVIMDAYPLPDSIPPLPANGHANGASNGLNGTHKKTNGQNGNHSNGFHKQEEASRVYVVSAKDSSAAHEMCKRISSAIRNSIDTGNAWSLDDLAFTLAERRSRLPWAGAFRAKSLAELAEKLDAGDRKLTMSNRRPRIGYVFNGQGDQWHAMGRELITTYSVFSHAVAEADRILKSYGASWSLLGEYFLHPRGAIGVALIPAQGSYCKTRRIRGCI